MIIFTYIIYILLSSAKLSVIKNILSFHPNFIQSEQRIKIKLASFSLKTNNILKIPQRKIKNPVRENHVKRNDNFVKSRDKL